MRCPMQTAHCHVKALGASQRTFGRPSAAAERYYSCDFHGHFTHDVERNAVRGGIPDEFQPKLRTYVVQFLIEGEVDIEAESEDHAREIMASMTGAEVFDQFVADETVAVVAVAEQDPEHDDGEDAELLRLVGTDAQSD